MIIHLGANTAVRAETVLLMTDLQQERTEATDALVCRMREAHRLRSLSPRPKTLVLCAEGTQTVCYLSGVGLRTLSARAREERTFFLRLMRREREEAERNEVQHDGRNGADA